MSRGVTVYVGEAAVRGVTGGHRNAVTPNIESQDILILIRLCDIIFLRCGYIFAAKRLENRDSGSLNQLIFSGRYKLKWYMQQDV